MRQICYALLAMIILLPACVEEDMELNRPPHAGGPGNGNDGGGDDDGGNEPDITYYHTGSTEDVSTNTSLGYLLAGGRSDQKSWFDWMVNKSGGGDFVVIRTSDSDGYNDESLIEGVNSIWTLVIDSRSAANSQFVKEKIRAAEALFIAGGDQSLYYDYWKGTEVEHAIHYLVNDKKVPVGGTSAGMAIMGELAYIPSGTAVISSEALRDPYHRNMDHIRKDFLSLPGMGNIITDSHFSERDRLGRTITFMARMIKDGQVSSYQNARAIAVDEYTAIGVDANGDVRVLGDPDFDDYAFFFVANSNPDVCERKKRLHWVNAVTTHKIKGTNNPSASFNISSWSAIGSSATVEEVNVNNGSISNDIQEPG